MNKKFSVLIPVFNSSKTIGLLITKIKNVLQKLEYKIILVNDSSTDDTDEQCKELYQNNQSKIIYIKLKKNFGEHNAVYAGLNYIYGDRVFIIDDDFQNDPDELIKMINYSYNNNFDVIYSKYKKKKHSIIRNFFSKINDLTANAILNKPKNIYLSSFKCIKKDVVDLIIKYTNTNIYIDGMIFEITSKIGQIEVSHNERASGKSNYNFFKLLKLYSNMVFGFSIKPLRYIAIIGIILFIFSLIIGGIIIFEKLFISDVPLGYSSLIISIIFFSSVQLIFIGVLSEYVGKILKNSSNAPQYSIDQVYKKDD
tara:strand:- start:1210 stop:2142 length:933 start_codon:yes stop_codon:yes gene_type:complete